ncbi:Druantia anti-phage system protein DruA [Burkholderia anthina]|uniref:Druantia anti-phage system protein DruA n=1 Tax=Burkholderia anthina TaxID=179879 RepID=UPI001639BBC4|nr:Druantia anti-phage system protein DruA [Burkholderia anthina]
MNSISLPRQRSTVELTLNKTLKGDLEAAAESAHDHDWRLLRPEIGDDGTAYSSLRRLAQLPRSDAIRGLTEFAQSQLAKTTQALKAKVSATLLRDLMEIGWDIKVTAHHIYVRPQRHTAVTERKNQIRKQLLYGRNDQLGEASHRKFLFAMERPSKYSSCRPITDLIADGRRLAEQLAPVAELPREQRPTALRAICKPYLQLVSDERDAFTNIRLIDIWRYFRHSWSTRYRSSPGRNMFYLVRDAGQPNHPVIGITALGNTVMQLTPRDQRLGWTLDGLLALCRTGEVSEQEILRAFRERLEEDFDQIYREDLPVERRIDHSVDDETLSRLAVIEKDANQDREDALRADDAAGTRKVEDLTSEQLLKFTKTPLYRAKRARAIREILRAYRTLATWHCGIEELAATDYGVWALNIAIKQLKKRFSATSMMELTVCGAVAPYNHLLGGKLVCLMMASPRVVRDYRDRYAETVSVIASQMAGRPITKEPSLAFLGTTSLYTDHSSQYNRVKLPPGTVDGQGAAIEYLHFGRTEGFGSPNLSAETELGLAMIAETSNGFRNVNFVFGEGQSPKLRQLREGFAALGLNRTNLLEHGAPRIIYGVPLARNFKRHLLGIDAAPDYSIDPSSEQAEASIADYWVSRWLASRLDHLPALQAVSRSTPLTERVSRLIPEREAATSPQQNLAFKATTGEGYDMADGVKSDERLEFIRLLYRNESAFSDHVPLTRLKELNIKTGLEDVVRKIVRAGGSVVITGNAGDGKTHAISLMKKELKEAEVITDASEMSSDEITARWQSARDAGKPFCIAINEGPLVDLIRAHRGQHPWLDGIRDQLMRLVVYKPLEAAPDDRGENWKPQVNQTVVLDLSLRRVLSADLIAAIIEKLTDEQWYQGCSACAARTKCAVTYNRKMLRSDHPKRRMVQMLSSLGKAGAKVTFREALAYISFTIFGGKTCTELIEIGTGEKARYYWNAFEGQGAIFELLNKGIDPMKQTNPRVDEDLWRGHFQPQDFVGNDVLPVEQRNLDELAEREHRNLADDFTALKRRWYFEHSAGALLEFFDASKLFTELQNTSTAMAIRLGRLISLINRWWNRSGEAKQEALRLWTRLSYQPRARSHAMVSGQTVNRNKLRLYRPELAPVLKRAYGEQPLNHLLLAPSEDPRLARLKIDTALLQGLLHSSFADGQSEISRRLGQFNDALAPYGDNNADVRTIEVLDPQSELRTSVVVDVVNRRYDSAE